MKKDDLIFSRNSNSWDIYHLKNIYKIKVYNGDIRGILVPILQISNDIGVIDYVINCILYVNFYKWLYKLLKDLMRHKREIVFILLIPLLGL